jgi:hypothetical protein
MQASIEEPVRRRRWLRIGQVLFVAVGYGCLVFALLVLPTQFRLSPGYVAGAWLLCALLGAVGWRYGSALGIKAAFEILVLGILPVWGAMLNESLPTCRVDACEDIGIQRPFATPEIYWLLALHACAALAYGISRRRPEALPPAVEALLWAGVAIGVGVDAVAAVQVVKLLPYAVALPITLPLLAPSLACLLMLSELRARGRQRALDSLGRVSARWLPLPLLGLYAAIEGLCVGRADAFVSVVTRTCSHPLSLGTLEIVHQRDCHYLCTVAANGHPRLVRPLRHGKRRGRTILVNRQLQVANAFEDLLHERWPRFGKLARAVYDRTGLPISRWIRTPLAADFVYLAMKPAEWLFYLVLLLLDPCAPEHRIARMYR